MQNKTKVIIILSSIIFILLLFIGIENFIFFKNKNNEIAKADYVLKEYEIREKEYSKKIEDRNKKVDEINKTKPVTEKELAYQKIIETDTELLTESQEQKETLKKQLEKTNDELKKTMVKKNEISSFILAGIGKSLQPDIYIGINYNRVLFSGKNIDIYIGGGAAVKVYSEFGGAIQFNFGLRF